MRFIKYLFLSAFIFSFFPGVSFSADYEPRNGDKTKRSEYVCDASKFVNEKSTTHVQVSKTLDIKEGRVIKCKQSRNFTNEQCNGIMTKVFGEIDDLYSEILNQCILSYPAPEGADAKRLEEAQEARPYCRAIVDSQDSFEGSSSDYFKNLARAKKQLKKTKKPLNKRQADLNKEINDDQIDCQKKDDNKDPNKPKCRPAVPNFGGGGFGGGGFGGGGFGFPIQYDPNLPICPQLVCDTCTLDLRHTCISTTSSSSATDNTDEPCTGPVPTPVPGCSRCVASDESCTETEYKNQNGSLYSIHKCNYQQS